MRHQFLGDIPSIGVVLIKWEAINQQGTCTRRTEKLTLQPILLSDDFLQERVNVDVQFSQLDER